MKRSIVLLFFIGLCNPVFGQQAIEESTQVAAASANTQTESDADKIARELANPNTPLASLTFRNQYRWYTGKLPGADQQSNFTLFFQPVLPFQLKNGNRIIVRPGISLIADKPVYTGIDTGPTPKALDGFDSKSGLADIGLDVLYGVTTDAGVIYGWGVFLSMPTASSDELGSDRWTIGPDFMLGKVTKKTVVFGLLSHQVDFAGSGDKDISLTTITLSGIYLPSGGWNVGTSPIINYDWESEDWTIPLNFAVGKTVMLKDRPWKLQAEVNYYVQQADVFGPEWMVALNITPVVKNSLAKFFE